MFEAWSLPALIAAFIGGAVAIWIAGVRLSNTADVLSSRFGIGQALGGVILLAIATNLPEIAITASAALARHVGLAVGNILGGIAIQTLVLVILDVFGSEKAALTYKAASLDPRCRGLAGGRGVDRRDHGYPDASRSHRAADRHPWRCSSPLLWLVGVLADRAGIAGFPGTKGRGRTR